MILKGAFLDEVAFLAAKVGKYLESVLDFQIGTVDLHVAIEHQIGSDGSDQNASGFLRTVHKILSAQVPSGRAVFFRCQSHRHGQLAFG